jgi:hypothetical protein
MARLDMALADVALAKQLAATLAGLPRPCGALRSQLVVAAEAPPWVKYVLFDGERGIALLDFAPARPSRGIAPLKAFLAAAGFADRYPGELPVVALELAPAEIPVVGERIAAAFAAAPPCTINDTSWCEAVNRLLMTADGLTMARVMPAPGAAAAGPVRLAEARRNAAGASAAPSPLPQKPILERPFLQQPLAEAPSLKRPIRERPFLQQAILERPGPKRAPLQTLFLRKREREKPFLEKPTLERPNLERPLLGTPMPEKPASRPGLPTDTAIRLRAGASANHPRAALAVAALSVTALAIGAVPYVLDASSPAAPAPTAISFPIDLFPIEAMAPQIPVRTVKSATATEGSSVAPSLVVEAVQPPSTGAVSIAAADAAPPPTIAEPLPAAVSAPSAGAAVAAPNAIATPVRSATATEGSVVAPSRFVDVADLPSIAEEPAPAPVSTSTSAVAEAVPSATAASMRSANATEGSIVAPPLFVEVAEATPPIPATPIRSAAAIDGAAEAPPLVPETVKVSETVKPFSVAAEAPPVWRRPPRAAARALPARSPASTASTTPIWRAAPIQAAGRTNFGGFVVFARTRDTR